MSVDEIYNAIQVNEQLLTSGQPTEDQLRFASSNGFARVINLAPFEPGRSLPDEAGLVRSLNMTYINIPVVWTDPKQSDFEVFEQTMSQLPDSKTLLHCVANFRVTAFYSLYAQKHLGWSEEQAATFRAKIWQGSNNPIWNDFIANVKSTFT
ncbi:MAG: protein tyrosine phosphatase family protein [Chloroflexota bacterium]